MFSIFPISNRNTLYALWEVLNVRFAQRRSRMDSLDFQCLRGEVVTCAMLDIENCASVH